MGHILRYINQIDETGYDGYVAGYQWLLLSISYIEAQVSLLSPTNQPPVAGVSVTCNVSWVGQHWFGSVGDL